MKAVYLCVLLLCSTALAGPEHATREWRKLRNAHIKGQPECQVCDIRAKGNQVHHIIPLRVDSTQFLNPTNLITLCQRHHFWVGHASDWKSANTNLMRSIEAIREAAAREIQR